MKLYKARLISALIAYGLIAGACLGAVIHYLMPVLTISWNIFAATLIFFIFLESLFISAAETSASKQESTRLVRIYMLSKVVKVLLTLVVILLYFIYDRATVKWFIIDYIILYLLFLIAESFLFVKIEKHYNIKK